MNTFDPSTNLDLRDGGLPAEDRGVDRLLGELGHHERSRATLAMLDRIAAGSWASIGVTESQPDSYNFAARVEAAPGGTTASKGTPWFTPMRAAAAIALMGAVAAGVLAVRGGSMPAPREQLAQKSDPTEPVAPTDTQDADLALIDALWSDTSSEDLWTYASEIGAGADVSLDDLLVGGTSDSPQGGAM
jgi:hypothetical protein